MVHWEENYSKALKFSFKKIAHQKQSNSYKDKLPINKHRILEKK